MTTVSAALPQLAATPTPRGRLTRIARLHLVNKSVFLGIPWLIVGMAWAVTMIVTALILGAGGEPDIGQRYSWAVVSPQWYLVVVGIQAVTLTFPFSLGFGATRRDFWLGTSLLFVALSAVNGLAFGILVQVENATGGWFIQAHMFDSLWYGSHGFWFDAFSTFSLQLFVLFTGAAIATIYMRWRAKGMLVWGAGLGVVALAFLGTLIYSDGWAALASWFTDLGVVGVFALLLLPTLWSAVLGYLVIRRATPR
jgi:hypothetical protein